MGGAHAFAWPAAGLQGATWPALGGTTADQDWPGASTMRITSIGHMVFAAVMVALGIQGLITGQFTAVWQPVPKAVPAREELVYVCSLVSLASGIGLLWKRTAAAAAGALFASLALWLLMFRLPVVFRAPAAVLSWDGCAETAVMVAGAWALYSRFAADGDRRWFVLATGERGGRMARVLYGLAMIPFGLAHFAFIKETAALVPGWLPAHVTWAYLTGAAFLAAGGAVLAGVWVRLGTALSALQIGLFTLLVWVPIVAAGSRDASQLSEFAISSALTAGAWVVAESCRSMSWVAVGKW